MHNYPGKVGEGVSDLERPFLWLYRGRAGPVSGKKKTTEGRKGLDFKDGKGTTRPLLPPTLQIIRTRVRLLLPEEHKGKKDGPVGVGLSHYTLSVWMTREKGDRTDLVPRRKGPGDRRQYSRSVETRETHTRDSGPSC